MSIKVNMNSTYFSKERKYLIMPNITSAIINNNYRQILKQDKGATFVKVDLHVHTPASGDAQSKNRYNFKFDITDIPKSLLSAKKIAKDIVERCKALDIKLIVITDHNTPSNTHPEDLANAWYTLISNAAKGEDLCVLPGVEISTDDLHILVILDPKENDPAAYTTHRINFLLQDCKFNLEDYGNYKATGMSSLFDVLQYIENLDTACIAIPAHIDGGHKALLTVYKEPSNVYNKLLNHPNLNAVEVVKDTTPTKKKIGKKNVEEYFSSLRGTARSPIAYVQNSDGHSIKHDGIGKRFTYVRMGKPGFWALKNALEDPETRVRLKKDYKPDDNRTSIIGIAYTKGDSWDFIAFNDNLNAIIGKKNTHKSTILDLLLYGLGRFEEEEVKDEKRLINEGYSVNIFIGKGMELFCFSRGKDGKPPTVFKLQDGSFTPNNGNIDLELPRRYNHNIIEGLFISKTSLMDFLDRRIFKHNKIQSYIEKRDLYIEKAKNKNLEKCENDLKNIHKLCEALFKERQKRADSFLNKYVDKSGKNLFKVNVKEGKWKKKKYNGLNINNIKDFFTDQAQIKVLIDSKYTSIKQLRTGERNAAQMVLLMNQDAFGPLLIDEPEQYLDISSIMKILIPQKRRLKARQQIICVTKDEHILLSGDTEQVIITQAEDKIKVITGDINNKQIQEQVIEIFEGNKAGLTEKNIKLSRLIE